MLSQTKKRILLMQGNEACAEGAIAAGANFFAGYPITPATEIAEVMSVRMPMIGGKFLQIHNMRALNMLAIGMVVGATGLIEPEVMERVIQKKFPKAYETNVKALHKGIEFTKSAR